MLILIWFFVRSIIYALLGVLLTWIVFWVFSMSGWVRVEEKRIPDYLWLLYLLLGLVLSLLRIFRLPTETARSRLLWYLSLAFVFSWPQAILPVTEFGTVGFPRAVVRALIAGPGIGLFFAWVARRIP